MKCKIHDVDWIKLPNVNHYHCPLCEYVPPTHSEATEGDVIDSYCCNGHDWVITGFFSEMATYYAIGECQNPECENQS